MLNDLDIGNIRDYHSAMDLIRHLLNLTESLNRENQELKRQLQELRDEINRSRVNREDQRFLPAKNPLKITHLKTSGKNQKKETRAPKKTASTPTRPDTAISINPLSPKTLSSRAMILSSFKTSFLRPTTPCS